MIARRSSVNTARRVLATVKGNKCRRPIGQFQKARRHAEAIVAVLQMLIAALCFCVLSRSTELALLLRQTFESVILTQLYPGSTLSLHVQLLQNDGAAFACAVNALTLALQNAGIPMKDMVCACTVGLHDTTPLLDLNFSERSPELGVTSLVHTNKIVHSHHFLLFLVRHVVPSRCVVGSNRTRAAAMLFVLLRSSADSSRAMLRQ